MCYNVAISTTASDLMRYFRRQFVEPERYQPVYHASGFAAPFLPVIASNEPDAIQLFEWGLIPFWVKDQIQANKLKARTLNARSETVHDKPSFRHLIMRKRCLVLVDGFFEWHHHLKKTFPYFIYMKDHRPFALAGIWDEWGHPDTDDNMQTFSIITTEANPLLAEIHNSKKRMPVILSHEDEDRWLDLGLVREEVDELMSPYDQTEMAAHPISKTVQAAGFNIGNAELLKAYHYPEDDLDIYLN